MPSNIDKKFIENLQNFTDSLENVVELMKQQSEKGDAVNKMLSALDGPKLSEISEDIKSILESNKNIDSRTKEILEEVKAARKQKEAGMFDKISNKENKEKIRDSIQTIILISGGVLALGMAFKIIGKVDFMSVISMSIAMLTMSYTFAEISKIKELDTKRVFMTGLSIVAMATAITASSFILKLFQPLDPIKMFSFIVVSSALGVASYFILKSIKDISMRPRDMIKYMALPLILPAIALGIALSSMALQLVQPVGLMQGISAIFTGIALIAGAYAVRMVMKGIGKLDSPKDLLKVGLAIALFPLIAGGIALSSYILTKAKILDNPIGLVFTSIAIGISMLAFAPTIFILGKMGLKQMLMGSLGAVVVSGAILAASWIISFGKYDGDYPSAKWALGVGLSLLLFTPAVLIIGILAMTGIGALAILAGSGLVLVVAASISATSHILATGNYKDYPSAGWAGGVGLSLLIFAPALLILGAIPLGKKLLERGTEMMKSVAQTIVEISFILSRGNFKGGPTVEWARGIGESLSVFKDAVGTRTKKAENLSQSMVNLATSMVYVSLTLAKGDWVNGVIPEDWMKNIYTNYMIYSSLYDKMMGGKLLKLAFMNKTMLNISDSMINLTYKLKEGDWEEGRISDDWMQNISRNYIAMVMLYELINKKDIKIKRMGETMKDIARYMVDIDKILGKGSFDNGPDGNWADGISRSMSTFIESIVGVDDKKLDALKDFSKVIRHLGRSVKRLRESGIDKLERLTASVTIMSVIDDQKLKKSIEVLYQNKDKISNVTDSRSILPTGGDRQKTSIIDKFAKKNDTKIVDQQEEMNKKFDNVIEKFDELLEYVIESKTPEDTGKKDSTKN